MLLGKVDDQISMRVVVGRRLGRLSALGAFGLACCANPQVAQPPDETASVGGPAAIAALILASHPELDINAQTPNVTPAPAPPSAATPGDVKLLSVESTRDFAVGTVRVVMDVSQGRRLPVQIWYPAVETARAEAKAGRPLQSLQAHACLHELQRQRFSRHQVPRTIYVPRHRHRDRSDCRAGHDLLREAVARDERVDVGRHRSGSAGRAQRRTSRSVDQRAAARARVCSLCQNDRGTRRDAEGAPSLIG